MYIIGDTSRRTYRYTHVYILTIQCNSVVSYAINKGSHGLISRKDTDINLLTMEVMSCVTLRDPAGGTSNQICLAYF